MARKSKQGQERDQPRKGIDPQYERKKRRASARQREQSHTAREISAECPAVVNPKRRARALKSFREFCRSYFPDVFFRPFSADHEKVISKMERAVKTGGLFALAMPRGSGKTALCAAACLWAVVNGFHAFVAIVGATQEAAEEVLAGLKTQLETNDSLLADFPELCYPIRRLEGVSQRRLLWKGELIRIKFTAKRLQLPSLPKSPAASGIIQAAGLTGRIRGMKFTRPDGKEVRPTLVTLDDPQTDDSAKSPGQCDTRERTIKGAVLQMAGPGEKIAAVMPCTVIKKGDLADRMLDRKLHPEWLGERMRLIYDPPTNTALWEEYWSERQRGLQEDETPERGNAFYRAHRAELDAGCRIAWPERFRPDELSAIQHAMNLKLSDPVVFAAEYQNEPPDEALDQDKPSLSGIAERTNGLNRRLLPQWANKLTAFVDVQARALYYAVIAFADDFSAALVDYGTEPDQAAPYFTLRDVRRTLEDQLAKAGKSGGLGAAICLGLDRLTELLFTASWQREDGAALALDRCLIDSGWGEHTETVYEFCRQKLRLGRAVWPSKGRGIKAGDKPLTDYKPSATERPGFHFVVSSDPAKRAARLLLYDTNFWKTFVARRVESIQGKGALTVWGKQPAAHRMLGDHCLAEYCEKTAGRGRTVWEWRQKPGEDNHLLDCIVGCYAGAAQLGCRLGEAPQAPSKKSTIPEHMIAGRAL